MASLSFNSLSALLISSIALVSFGVLLRRRVRTGGRIPLARAIIVANSYLYAAASLWFCLAVASSLSATPHKETGPSRWLDHYGSAEAQRNMYHFSKLYEYLDVWLVLAN